MRTLSLLVASVLVLTTQALPAFNGAPTLGNHQPAKQHMDMNAPGKPQPSETFPFHAELDPNFDLHWSFNDTHIVFEMVVHTNGYVGFGISPNGRMYPADVIVGWVKDGKSHFADRHTTDHIPPAVDSHQDWTLLLAREVGDYTTLKVVRKLDTCDPQDRPIMDGTTRVIYAYHPDDPLSDSGLIYHGGSQRGTKSLLLLDPPTEDKGPQAMPDDLMSMDFLNQNYHVPADDTTYHCTIFKIPDLGGKKHQIRYEPVIQKGHEKLVHHMILYACSGHVNPSVVGRQFKCNSGHNLAHCENVFTAWAIGGTGFNFPAHVGFSMGTAEDPMYVKLETHYDNPDMRSDFVDNSGMRLFLTSHIRQYDAGILETGVNVDNYQIVPPYEAAFLSSGYCHENCVGEALGNQEIRVFSNLLHSHLAGSKLRTRHFRHGVELPPISEDNTYDFDFQEQRILKDEIVIKKGDSLITECVYDTTQRTTLTYGGLSSREEMCLAFLIYYPRMPLSKCLSRVLYKIPAQFHGRSVFDIVKHLDWTDPTVREAFKKDIEESDIGHACAGIQVTGDKYYSIHGTSTPLPTIVREFHKNATCPTH